MFKRNLAKSEWRRSNSEVNPVDSFSSCGISNADTVKSILSVKSNAVGLDDLPLEFIKIILPGVLPFITYIYKQILTTSTYPDLWKIPKVISVHKGGASEEQTQEEQTRPVSILKYCMHLARQWK